MRTPKPPAGSRRAANVDDEGDPVVQASVLLHGGVTEENLHLNFSVWKQTIEEILHGLE